MTCVKGIPVFLKYPKSQQWACPGDAISESGWLFEYSGSCGIVFSLGIRFRVIALAVSGCFGELRFGKISYQRFDLFHSVIADVAIGRTAVAVAKKSLGVGSFNVCLGRYTRTNIVKIGVFYARLGTGVTPVSVPCGIAVGTTNLC